MRKLGIVFLMSLLFATQALAADYSGSATGVELDRVHGVTSAIQDQLDAKQATVAFGANVEAALGVDIGSVGAPVLLNGAGGTPSSLTLTNATGLPVSTGLSGTLANLNTVLGITLTKTGTLTDTKVCVYDQASDSIVCDTDPAAGAGDVTAASSFGTDNVLIKSDGTGKGVQATGISVDDSNNVTGVASIEYAKSDGIPGDTGLYEANSTDTDTAGFRGPDSLTGSWRMKLPDTRSDSANMVLACTNVGEAGDGGETTPYVQDCDWFDLDTLLLLSNLGADVYTALQVDIGSTGAVLVSQTGPVAVVGDAGGSSQLTLPNGTSTLKAGTAPIIAASGSVAFNPTSIASGACSSAVDGGTATGVVTTDVIDWGFSGDPTASTGYAPSTDGGLYIVAYPTADHVNFVACNNTSGAIDPDSITLNWHVLR